MEKLLGEYIKRIFYVLKHFELKRQNINYFKEVLNMNSSDTLNLKTRLNNVNTCPDCGTQNQANSKFCKNCGKNFKEISVNQQLTTNGLVVRKDPGLAGVFSAILPGLGQVYNEQLLKAFILVIIGSITLFLLLSFTWTFLFASPASEEAVSGFFSLVCGIIYLLIWLIGVNDAQKSARKINMINSD